MAALVALRLLELVALLFPVVALLLQLQNRAVESDELQRLGLLAGLSQLSLLSATTVLAGGELLLSGTLPPLLALVVGVLIAVGLSIPVLVVASSARFVAVGEQALERIEQRLRHRGSGGEEWSATNAK
jgi:hypothetical protein